jgi:thiol-disulfide isomerase/thioredoxin
LKGRVVLIDFWTYSCINCIRTQPYLKGWDETYRDSGLTIIGVHAPEFAFEKNQANVKAAAQRAGLRYPIALDNDFATWNAFQNQYWPASYLIDAEGQVRRVHAGEGQYAETEDAIRQLLRDAGKRVPEAKVAKTDERAASTPGETPETYLGTRRASNFEGEPGLRPGTARFTPVSDLSKNRWTLGGNWNVSSESIIAGDNASLRFRTASQNVYLVAGQADAAKITVSLNGRPISQTKQAGNDVKNSAVTVTDAKLYQLVKRDGFDKDSVVELQVPAGTPLTVFTFGQ